MRRSSTIDTRDGPLVHERWRCHAMSGLELDAGPRGFWLRDADQKRLVLGKSYYGYVPLGPWMVTADEVPNPQEVDLWLEVNGVRRQTGNTCPQAVDVRGLVVLHGQVSDNP